MENKKAIKISIFLSLFFLILSWIFSSNIIVATKIGVIFPLFMSVLAPGFIFGGLVSQAEPNFQMQVVASIAVFLSNALLYFLIIKLIYFLKNKHKK